MVHKKYIKVGDKTYGPYYYESYREDGKIKKRYYKFPDKYRRVKGLLGSRSFIIIYIALVAILLLFTFANYFDVSIFEKFGPEVLLAPFGASVGFDGNANLTIYDDSDLDDINNPGEKVKRYSYCDEYCAQKNKPSSIVWTFSFYANYTDNIGNAIDGSQGSCNIRFDDGGGYGAPQSMIYDISSLLWKISTSFLYKGVHNFEVSCTSGLGNPLLENAFVVTNSEPYIIKTASGFIDFNADGLEDSLRCIEDQLCMYNFSGNVSEDDANDILVYGYSLDKVNINSKLTNFSVDSEVGGLEINITRDEYTGSKQVELNVRDSESPLVSAFLRVQIDPVNDAPNYINLENKSFNMSELFEYVIIADDEEKNFPLTFNIEFLNCTTAEWSTRGSNCVLFDNTNYIINETSINISFIPTRNDVGNYVINISAIDSLNAINSQIINFTVDNINAAPIFEDICGNQGTAIEDSQFSCAVTALDIDEVSALIFSSNESWFLDRQVISVGLLTNFRGSANVDFRPSDANVGNWQINISVEDSGNPKGINSSVIPFFADNIPDNVYIDNIPDFSVYTNNLYSIPFNATDDDLLIPDKSVYDESLSFSSNLGWINVRSLGVVSGTNRTRFAIEFNPNVGGVGTHSVSINALDSFGNSDSEVFDLTVLFNNLPIWDINTPVTYVFDEDSAFNLNLMPFVSDLDNDPLSFSFSKEKVFPSFDIDSLTGIINFAPIDEDVGEHIIIINVSDGKSSVPLSFNFTVYNINDAPIIKRPLDGNNLTVNSSNSNINTTEDQTVELFMFVEDNDLAIPVDQRSFYQELININLGIEGPNVNLFDLQSQGFIPPNQILFRGSFVSKKTDVGYYNVSVNASDASSDSDFIEFNLTINEINHAPSILNLGNLTSTINRNLFFDINSSDVEDGFDEQGNLSYRYEYILGDSLFNDTTFNTTTGVINISFNETNAGMHIIKVSVNDSSGAESSEEFAILVYGPPIIESPSSGKIFNFAEGNRTYSNFSAYHSIGDNLTYEFYVHDILRDKKSYYGNGTNITFAFVPGYEDETYGLFGNLTLLVYPSDYKDFNVSRTWRVNITHANAPVIFAGFIGDKQGTVGQAIFINLSNYFLDADAFDPHYNQSVNFSIKNNGSLSSIFSTVNDWILSLNSGASTDEQLSIIAGDIEFNSILTNVSSNLFRVVFVEPPKVIITTPTSSNSEVEKPVLLKLVLPGPISVKKGESIILPIGLENEATVVLRSIQLSGLVAFEGVLQDKKVSFSKDFILELGPEKTENISLTIETGLLEVGLYEVHVNATVASPRYKDWGKIYINVLEGDTIIEKLVFTEEFIAENPECAEIKELVDESKVLLDSGNVKAAESKLEEAVEACKLTISKQSFFSQGRLKSKFQDRVFIYLLITTVLSISLGITYYIYRKTMIKRALLEAQKSNVFGNNYGEGKF